MMRNIGVARPGTKVERFGSIILIYLISMAGLAGPASATPPVRNDVTIKSLNELTAPRRYDPRDYCVYPSFENPHVDRINYTPSKPDLLPMKVDIEMAVVVFERQVCSGHVLRIPPAFPAKFLDGHNSGFCKFSFAYAEDGRPNDIQIISCTDESLAEPTVKAVRKRQPVSANCLETRRGQRQFSTMRYDLVDKNGNLLPLP